MGILQKQHPAETATGGGNATAFQICLASVTLLAAALLFVAPAAAQDEPAQDRCASLANWTHGAATVASSELVEAGQLKLPETGLGRLAHFTGLDPSGHAAAEPNSSFCRVALKIKPSSDSDINVEIWLPTSGWNGKLLGAGGFGWSGSMMYPGMIGPLREGYAVATTDTGHSTDGGSFALGHPEKLVDYAYRANHEMTVAAKALAACFYGKAPTRSYWAGCSLGGIQGLIEAKRYPEDYDAIVVGAPPNPLANFNAAQLWPYWLVAQDHARLIPKDKYRMVHDAVMRTCGSQRERDEDVLEQPGKCTFDPAQLLCKTGDSPDCLTAPQVYLLQQIYAGPSNPRTGEKIFPGPAFGTELELPVYASEKPFPNALDLFRYVVFNDASWMPDHFDWDKDMLLANEKAKLLSVDADLKPFLDRGGKLLLYVGWNDYHNPTELAEYYRRVIRTAGESAQDSVRLFAIPDMGHCFGGAGCDTFDKLGVLAQWDKDGKAPERILVSKVKDGQAVQTRPICAYPKLPKYIAPGEANDPASATCTSK
jgi:feruloyl esterase